MIVFLEGTLLSAKPLHAVVLAGGVGYGVHVPLPVAERLPGVGKPVRLHVRQVLREDSSELYGFLREEDRDFFDLLTGKVSGIGPKIGLNLMSRISPDTLRRAIGEGDVTLLSKCAGIGKKTAERIVIELRDKLGVSGGDAGGPAEPGAAPQSHAGEAVAALMALGYKLPDADKAVRRAVERLGAEAATEELVRAALG